MIWTVIFKHSFFNTLLGRENPLRHLVGVLKVRVAVIYLFFRVKICSVVWQLGGEHYDWLHKARINWNARALNFESAIALDFRCPLKRRRAEIISCALGTILIYAGRHKNVCALGLRIKIDRFHRRGATGENNRRKRK